MTTIYRTIGYYFTNLQLAMEVAKNNARNKAEERGASDIVKGEWRNDENGLKYVAKWETRSGKVRSTSKKVTFIGVNDNKYFDTFNKKE